MEQLFVCGERLGLPRPRRPYLRPCPAAPLRLLGTPDDVSTIPPMPLRMLTIAAALSLVLLTALLLGPRPSQGRQDAEACAVAHVLHAPRGCARDE